MFDTLSEKLQGALAGVRERGTLTEDDIKLAMREVRLALLEADVNFRVVREFTATVRERCTDEAVLGHLNPGQQVVKVVDEELTTLMGGAGGRHVTFSPRPPTVVLMAGLQGSGKTTAAAKLALHLRRERSAAVALAACDVHRPAAIDQLVTLGRRADVEVYERGAGDAVEIAAWARERARTEGKDVLIVDTAG